VVFQNSVATWSGVGSTGRLYTIDPSSGAATLKFTLMADTADLSSPFTALSGNAFGVDVNTGVKASDGFKDPDRVLAFVRNARAAAARTD
jgi:hypothetical protein